MQLLLQVAWARQRWIGGRDRIDEGDAPRAVACHRSRNRGGREHAVFRVQDPVDVLFVGSLAGKARKQPIFRKPQIVVQRHRDRRVVATTVLGHLVAEGKIRCPALTGTQPQTPRKVPIASDAGRYMQSRGAEPTTALEPRGLLFIGPPKANES